MPSVVQLAREAAAAARAGGWAEREAFVPPATRFLGVHVRGKKYAAVLWNRFLKKNIRLGSYATAVEAAFAYDAAARSVLGVWARPNFPALSPSPVAVLARARRAAEPTRQQQQQLAPRYRALRMRCWSPAPSSGAATNHPERVVPGSAPTRGGLYGVAFVPGVPDLNDPVPDTSAAAAAPSRRELPHMPAMAVEPDQSVVGDNFTDA